MHVSEQPADVEACMAEYKLRPVDLLEQNGLLDSGFTAVHAIHVTSGEISALSRADATVCACPTTERNLGDGTVPADQYLSASVPISLGTDSNLRAPAGSLDIGRPADFFTVALDDPSLAGADSQSLLSSVVFSAERSAVRDVVVAGKFGRHPQAGQIIEGFKRLQPDL